MEALLMFGPQHAVPHGSGPPYALFLLMAIGMVWLGASRLRGRYWG